MRTGKNLYDFSIANYVNDNLYYGGYASGLSTVVDHSLVLKAGTYVVSANIAMTGWYLFDDSGQIGLKYNNTEYSFTLTEEKAICVRCYKSSSGSKEAFATFDFQLELGSSASDYEPYTATTIPITFPDAAGTVYGAKLINEGTETWKLSVNMASVDMGTLTWGKGTESDKPFFLTESLKDVIKQIPNNTTKATIKTPIYITTTYWGGNPVSFMNTDFDITQTSGSHQIRTRDSRYSTEQEYKTAMSGVQLVYELATPIEYTLTESQALTLLKGENCVWCDGSDDLELQYYAKAEETP